MLGYTDVTAYGVCLLLSAYGMVLGFIQSIYIQVLLKSVGSIGIGIRFYRSTQPTYYQMSTRPSN